MAKKKSGPLRVSQSKVGVWRKCHAAFYYRYDLKLRKKRKERPLVFGDIVHQMIEVDANGGDPFKRLEEIEKSQGKMFRSMEEEYGALIEDVEDIMTDYWGFWDHELEYLEFNKKRSEFTFEVEVDKDILLIGKIDNLGRTKKLKWLVEHKTGKSVPNEDHRWKSIQSAIYIRVAEMIGIKVDGTLWDFIRSKPPGRPKILKKGDLSTREVDTLPSRITRFYEEQERDQRGDEYRNLIKRAEANRTNYFQRIFTPTKKKVVDLLFDDFIVSAREIADRKPNIRDRNIGRHCDWCTFESICRAELRGADVDFVIKSDYVVSGPHEEEEPDFEA